MTFTVTVGHIVVGAGIALIVYGWRRAMRPHGDYGLDLLAPVFVIAGAALLIGYGLAFIGGAK
jgi:hypothetical protein